MLLNLLLNERGVMTARIRGEFERDLQHVKHGGKRCVLSPIERILGGAEVERAAVQPVRKPCWIVLPPWRAVVAQQKDQALAGGEYLLDVQRSQQRGRRAERVGMLARDQYGTTVP
jgi:hypothetical protein